MTKTRANGVAIVGDMDQQDAPAPSAGRPRAAWKRYAPISLIALGAAAAIYFFGDLLSFEALKEHRETLLAWRDDHYLLAIATFFLVYVLSVAFSIPGAIWLTLAGGFLFGVWVAAPLIVVAATVGATAIFLAARSSLGAALKERAGPWLDKLEAGFRANAASYMLIMRLAPAVPFFVANLAPAFLGVPLSTYLWTTLLGIMPATVIYCWVGAGLGDVIAMGGEPDLGVIFEPQVLGPLLGLAALSALPIALKALGLSRRRGN